jgi:hypothetical protein
MVPLLGNDTSMEFLEELKAHQNGRGYLPSMESQINFMKFIKVEKGTSLKWSCQES